ncbi:hypothetical protein EK904_008578 [Melospiza melodia maxima]|nr:hypothetical protein EK904_008578 [Melospiza melodia maxima]
MECLVNFSRREEIMEGYVGAEENGTRILIWCKMTFKSEQPKLECLVKCEDFPCTGQSQPSVTLLQDRGCLTALATDPPATGQAAGSGTVCLYFAFVLLKHDRSMIHFVLHLKGKKKTPQQQPKPAPAVPSAKQALH